MATMMSQHPIDPVHERRLRQSSPIDALPDSCQRAVLLAGEFLRLDHGETVFAADTQDEHVHFLVDGSVSVVVGGQEVAYVSAHEEASRCPLDDPGMRRTATVVVGSPAMVFRVPHEVLSRETDLAERASPAPPRAVMEAEADDPANWFMVTLRQGLFANLPVATIERVLDCAVAFDVSAGEVIVEQGRVADAFYLVKRGTARVDHQPTGASTALYLTDIGPGDGFGEEALVSNRARNATVTMTSDGTLLKLKREHFETLIRDPLLHDMSLPEAEQAVAEGAVWIDARSPADFSGGAMPEAISMPLSLVRVQWETLARERRYVVYSHDARTSAVAAFLLCARGLDAHYVDDEVQPLLNENDLREPDATPPEPAAPAPEVTIRTPVAAPAPSAEAPAQPSLYADTLSGQHLAELVEEIRADAEELARTPPDPRDQTLTGNAEISLDDTLFKVAAGDSEDDTPSEEAAPAAQAPAASDALSGLPGRIDDALGHAFVDLESMVRERLETIRREERARVEAEFQQRVAAIRQRAEQLVRERLRQARAKDRERGEALEARTRERFERLATLASRITHQKVEIQRARRLIEQKLKAADVLHRELAQLGETMTREIGSLEELMPESGIGTQQD